MEIQRVEWEANDVQSAGRAQGFRIAYVEKPFDLSQRLFSYTIVHAGEKQRGDTQTAASFHVRWRNTACLCSILL